MKEAQDMVPAHKEQGPWREDMEPLAKKARDKQVAKPQLSIRSRHGAITKVTVTFHGSEPCFASHRICWKHKLSIKLKADLSLNINKGVTNNIHVFQRKKIILPLSRA